MPIAEQVCLDNLRKMSVEIDKLLIQRTRCGEVPFADAFRRDVNKLLVRIQLINIEMENYICQISD